MPRVNLISFAVALSLSAASHYSNALGLGNTAIQGVLNRPLHVELPLIAEDYDLFDIRASLANEKQHQRFGLLYPEWMPKLNFKVVESRQGSILEITTFRSIKEPIVNFVVAVSYKETVLFKEITLFLDPAGFNQTSVKATSALLISPNQTPQIDSKQNISIQSTAKASSIKATSYNSSPQSFRVKRGQSLWRIARAWKIKETSLTQRMQAIFVNNQHAFIKGDKNKLKEGSIINLSTNFIAQLAAETKIIAQSTSQQKVIQQEIVPSNLAQTTAANITQELTANINPTIENTSSTEPLTSSALLNQQSDKRLQVELELAELNATIVTQQALNQSLQQQLSRLENQIELQQKIKQAQRKVNPITTVAQTNQQNSQTSSIKTITQNNIVAPVVASNNEMEVTNSSSSSIWLTAIWFSLALVLAYLASILTSKRKARVFANKLDHKLQDMAYNQEKQQSETPSVKELSIPKHLSTSVQIKYLNSAADFYIRCHRHDLAKELVNEGLIQFSGNTQIIKELNEIRKRIFSNLDSDLHSHIVEKLESREAEEKVSGQGMVEEKINIDEFNDEWFKQWNKKAS